MSKPKDHDSTEDLLSDLLGPDFMATGMANPHATAAPESTPSQECQDPTTETEVPAEETTAQGTEATAPVRRRRSRATEAAAQKQQKSGVGAMVGAACLFGGILATVLQGSNAFTTTLRSIGLDAPVLLTIGAVVFVLSIVRRQHALAQMRYEQLAQAQSDKENDLQGSLQYLVEQHQISSERPPAEGEELQRVLVSLQRQDEKVGNLTKALKMYGKPLMEIASQGNEIAAQVQQLKQQLDAMQKGAGTGQAVNAQVDMTPVEKRLAETQKDLLAAIAAMADRMPKDAGVLPILQRIESSLASLTQRIDDSETRKAITRLEETHRAQTQKLDKLADQASVHEEMQRLERVVDATVGKLTHTVDQVRDKDLGGLENSVREIQREVTGLGNSISSLQQALRSGATAAPRATVPAAHHETPVAQSAHVAEEPHHAAPMAGVGAAAPAASPGGPANDAQAGVAENRTGTRATSSKNVLGAIAKLKQMKH
jgi:hypothetical protein